MNAHESVVCELEFDKENNPYIPTEEKILGVLIEEMSFFNGFNKRLHYFVFF